MVTWCFVIFKDYSIHFTNKCATNSKRVTNFKCATNSKCAIKCNSDLEMCQFGTNVPHLATLVVLILDVQHLA